MKIHKSSNIGWWGILGITAVCLISRLPQLMSPYLHVDGDECVLGLMANHIASGQEFPFYFWGQKYGFSWIEGGAVALAIKFFGIGLYSLKIPALLLWTAGCAFFYAALAKWTTKVYGFWITCLLILSPSWMDWSMRARGGYITAFLLTSIVLFLLASNWKSLPKKVCLAIGILSGFIYYSQPGFMLGVLPLLVYAVSKNKTLKKTMICAAGFISVLILGKVMAYYQGNTDFWQPVWYRPDDHWGTYISSFKERIFNAIDQDSNTYSFKKHWAPMVISNAWCAVLLANFSIYIFRLIIKKVSILSTLLLISVVLILGCTYFVSTEYRYLLSLNMFLILWFGVLSFEWLNKNIFSKAFLGLIMAVFIVLGGLMAWDYRDFYRSMPTPSNEAPEMQNIAELIKFLKESGVKYVFTLNNELGWKLSFFSKEQIIARWMTTRDRRPEYITAIDQAFLNGQPVAVIGDIFQETIPYFIIKDEGKPDIVADKYYVYLDPSKKLIIRALRFQFDRPQE